jgi:hypothetical protein
MARKVYRKKRRSCRICKPGKRGLAPRWTRGTSLARLGAGLGRHKFQPKSS